MKIGYASNTAFAQQWLNSCPAVKEWAEAGNKITFRYDDSVEVSIVPDGIEFADDDDAETPLVIVNDSQADAQVARKADLITALDQLGWEKTIALGSVAYIAPESEEDDAYLALCNMVTAQDVELDYDEMSTFAYAPAEQPNFRVWTLS